MRQLESPDARLRRTRKCAAFVAEHLALDQVARDGSAIDAHERLVPPRTSVVDRAGDELLSGSRLAADENSRVRGRDARDHLPHAVHRLARPHHLAGVPQLRAEGSRHASSLSQLERRRDG